MAKIKEPKDYQKDLYIPEVKLTQVDKIDWDYVPIIDGSKDAIKVFNQYIIRKNLANQINVNEFAFFLYLNNKGKVLGITNHSVGGIGGTVMDFRLVFAQAVLLNATGIIAAHNHPSGNLMPSRADRNIAKQMQSAGNIMEIKLMDFMIITSSSGYYSFVDQNEESIYAKGGVTGYERLVKKVAANYEGKAVPSKYQSKYGKRYDADEAKQVGYAVATKVYGKPMARMAEGGETDSEITAEDRMIAQQHNYKLDL